MDKLYSIVIQGAMALLGLALSVFRGDAVCRDPVAEQKQPQRKKRLRIRLVYEWV